MTGFPNADAPSPELLQRCVHCGFCLPTCPTYAVLGVEMDSPRGRIRLMETVWQGRVDVTSDPFERHMYGCLDCRACETACPSGVEFGKLMEGARSQIEAARRRSATERLIRLIAFRFLLPRPAVLGSFAHFSVLSKRLGAAAVLRAVGSRVGLARRLAGLLDLVPDRASSRALPATYAARGARRGTVALFTGCVMRAAFADTNAATARVLARNGFDVIVPETQTCCGALHAHAGERVDARVPRAAQHRVARCTRRGRVHRERRWLRRRVEGVRLAVEGRPGMVGARDPLRVAGERRERVPR
jgi:glycolate oxidase iron-sulfur subunit